MYTKEKLAFIFKKPEIVIKRLFKKPNTYTKYVPSYYENLPDLQFNFFLLSQFLSIDISYIKKINHELLISDFMNNTYETYHSQKNVEDLKLGLLPIHILCPILYLLCRIYKPKIVVETGVASGFSSMFILKALEDNKQGNLYSIDLPLRLWKKDKPYGKLAKMNLPQDKEVGWVIPTFLRHRWKLIVGNSLDKLKPLLSKLDNIDMFFHDSEHSYETMSAEYNIVWPHIRKGSLLISDDVDRNTAFIDFSKKYNLNKVILSNRLGILSK